MQAQTASRLAVLPPPTQMTSCASRWARTSGTFGIGKSVRCELMNPTLENALCTAANRVASSPTAVAMTQTRGWAPAPARSAASR